MVDISTNALIAQIRYKKFGIEGAVGFLAVYPGYESVLAVV
jgi:hypothetical protein